MENKPKIKSIAIHGMDIEYLHYPAAGPRLVLLHATGFLPWIWHPVAKRLCDQFEVIVPYFCDHRTVSPHEGGVGWFDLARDLFKMLNQLDEKDTFVAGHSMGASVASLAVGACGLSAKKLVLIEPIYLPEAVYRMDIAVDQHPLAAKSIKRKNFWTDRNQAADYLGEKPLFANWDKEVLSLYLRYGLVEKEAGGLTLACQPEHEASLFMGSRQKDPWPVLPRIHCPVLIMEGENSENRSFIDLKKATSLFPSAHYELVDGVGHLIPMEKPVFIADRIQAFFAM